MAIEIIIGNVGAGKTYYATWRVWQEVKKIYEAEIKGTDYKYKRILTNIEGLQENKYVKPLKVDLLIKLYKEEFEKYKEWENANAVIDFTQVKFTNTPKEIDVVSLHHKEIEKRVPNHFDNLREYRTINERIIEHIKLANEKEKAYIEYTKPIFEKNGFSDCLIIIDEAHNFFKTLSAAKERLVSYHRHFDQDYILITQDLKQLNKKVTGIAQKTIQARNPVMKASKNFTYKVYSGGYISFRDTNLLEKITLKADPDIFNLYNSGSSKKQKSYLFKVLAKPILMVIAVLIGIFYLMHSLKTNHHTPPKHSVKTKTPIKHKKIVVKPKPKKKIIIHYTDLNVLKIGNFYIYKNKKYYWIDFRQALNKCNALAEGFRKNLDSTVTLYYKIKDPKCLDTYLSSSAL